MRKKLISIALSIMLIFNSMSVQYASANEVVEVLKTVSVNGVALGAGALGGAVALLAVLGVYVASENDAVRKAAVDLYNYCDDTNKQAIADMSGYYNLVSDSLYTQAQQFVNTAYSVGNSVKRFIDYTINADGTVSDFNGYTDALVNAEMGVSARTDGQYVYYDVGDYHDKIDYGPSYYNAKLPISIEYSHTTMRQYTTSYSGVDYNRTEYTFRINVYNADHEFVRQGYVQGHIDTLASTGVYREAQDANFGLSPDQYYDYTKSGVSVPLPKTASGERVIAVPDVVGLEGVEVTGDMCVPVANAIPAEIADTIVEYPETEEPAENLPKVDYPKMSIPPKLGLTRKFPFSIPWDLKNAVTTLVAEPKCPKWEINWDSEYFVGGGKTVIDFEKFETWAKIVRWGVLIVFNIGLIIATRKLIGAGG
ncbi:hypothetical protein [Ruminiclostridium cellulolyticum]|uniref:Uncharacterized protein n=1 Tax=Ruminiclostridium cellulolyticum (strain ATCC 35319 / DSM 5812 / JCM 6584 / H10) TaxID=394503 RepID=B8I2C9_RUMCH|nr:hypothetical protein [Ruminiclostridium cellulolyticum]ACL75922.1 hypothetical protein Ccel_1570 [Ruminiclostridium cellulolyticum H10]ACL75933.1 hypothetical protein Ccel_1581 [Ruminiclostridium cellulolyticum H10]ACL75944.1 hypothetical protein Ccel_1592 [Ruminiclostridium cellulolyticum H10]